jgi:hypothetical protein
VAAQGGRLVVAELQLTPARGKVPSGGITQDVLRRVRLSGIGPAVMDVRSWAQNSGIGGLRAQFNQAFGTAFPQLQADPGARPRQERATGRPDLFYARLAAAYVKAAKSSRTPIKDLAAARKLPASRVRDMVHEARVRGLLSTSDSGIRGGFLLPRAEAMLKKGGGR